MVKTYKVRLEPNNKQHARMMQFAGAARYAYNWAIRKEKESYESGNELCRLFTKHKAEADWLSQAVTDVVIAFTSFFKGRANFPKFKSRKRNKPSFCQNGWHIMFNGTHVKLEKISKSQRPNRLKLNWVKLSEKCRIPFVDAYLNPRITFDGLHWYVSVGVEVPVNTTEPTKDGIGIDLGLKELAVCSDGHTYGNINRTDRVKRLEKAKRRKQRQISRKYLMNKEGNNYVKTKNIEKAELRLLKKNHKLTNIRKDYIHKVTTDIVKREPSFIVLEDLNISGMLKNKHLSKYVQQQNFYKFRELLTYKAERAGIKLIIADRFYPSSKACSHCGTIKADLKLSDRVFKCNNCSLVIDRDLNASLNLYHYGTVSSTGINVCGVPYQSGVATAKQGTMKQKANIKSIKRI